VLLPEVFKHLDRQERGAGNEIQLTDAMAKMVGNTPFHALRYAGRRYDCGNRLGFLEANLAIGLSHAEIGNEVRAMAKALLKE
jgi:UTP--glucose-1-phosphate uridylyltransferase